MKTIKKATVLVDKVDSILCNMCGEKIVSNELGYFDDSLNIEKTWGFGSDLDGQIHHIDLCLSCYKNFIKQFKISPLE